MDSLWQQFLELDSFWYWGIGLVIIFPLSIILMSEVIYKADRQNKSIAKPLSVIKNLVLPLAAVILLFTEILDYDRDSLTIKILETILWVLILNYGLSVFTQLFLKKSGSGLFKQGVPQLFLDIFRVAIVSFGGAVLLSVVWGQELGSLVTALGLGSFVLGLALQDTLGNLFSGIALIYEKPFNVGDFITVDDQSGKVVEMNWRAVHLVTRKKELLVMPHRMIAQAAIKNYSRPSRVHIMEKEVGFSYDDAPNIVKQALMDTCLNTPGILHNPLPEVKTMDYGDNAIIYEIEYGIEDFAYREEISDELVTRIWYTARRNGFSIPFPQRTLHYAETAATPEEENQRRLQQGIEELPDYLPIEPEQAKNLMDGSNVTYFGKGEVIYKQGDYTGPIYVLLKGDVTLYSNDNSQDDVVISKLHKGDFFGEVALLSKRRSLMTAIAKSDVEVLVIPQDEVMDLVSENPGLAFKLGEVIEMRKNTRANKLMS